MWRIWFWILGLKGLLIEGDHSIKVDLIIQVWLYKWFRVQRRTVLQPAIRASCSQHVLAHKSFQLAPKSFLISRIDYNPSVIWISPEKQHLPIAKCNNPGYRTRLSLHAVVTCNSSALHKGISISYILGIVSAFLSVGAAAVLCL